MRLPPNPAGRCRRSPAATVARASSFAQAHGIPSAYGSYAELLDAPDIDVVYISLPNHLHAEWSVRALDAGKHVLCEKPLALTVADVDAIGAAARRSGRVAVEAFMYLHHPQIRQAVQLAQSGALGPLELVSGSFSFFLTYPNDPRIDPEMGGGSLWDVGCYPVSLARRVAGEEPSDLAGFARFDGRGVDLTFVGQLRFPSGLLAQFDCGFAAPDRERIEIVGQQASLVLDAPFLPEPDGPPPSLTLRRGRDCDAPGGRLGRPVSRRGCRSHERHPGRHRAGSEPRVQSRRDRDARRAGPGGPARTLKRVARRASPRMVVAAGIAAVGLVAIVAIAAAGGALSLPSASSAALGPPHFVDETNSVGIVPIYTPTEDIGIGGGVAVFDCNGDGRPDLYFAGGGQPAMLARNDSATGGALRFTPIGDAVTNIGGVSGAYPLDVDGDGITDLAVLRVGGLDLLRGLGDCRFVPANAQWAIDAGNGWTTAFSATWEADAALPTLAVGNYLRLDAKGPATYACDDNALLRPRPDGARLRGADHPEPGVLRAVDAVQRLGRIGAAGSPGQQRPPVLRLPERRGAALARRAG